MNKETTINTKATVEFRDDLNAFCTKYKYNRSEWIRNTLKEAMKREIQNNKRFEELTK